MAGFTDVSIDLETLGVRPGSVITQIGLCAFDRRMQTKAGALTGRSSLQLHIDPQDAMNRGQTIDWSTISWWLQQDEGPRTYMAKQKGYALDEALRQVTAFIDRYCGSNKKDYCVWGHGSGFDCTQLEIAYGLCRQVVPWDFRNVRDLRTLLDQTPNATLPRPEPVRAHVAVEDAIAQADWIKSLTHNMEGVSL